MVYQCDYREANITAVDTLTNLTAKGGATPGDFDLPANASVITEVIIQAVGGFTADSALAFTSAITFQGTGITGEQNYPGPSAFTCAATNISPGALVMPPVRYLTNIPFTRGGIARAQGVMLGEDAGDIQVQLGFVYDGIPGRIKEMDYREANLTAANTLVELADRNGTSSVGKLKAPRSAIAEIHVDAIPKVTEGATLTVPTAFHFSGPGFKDGAEYDFPGPAMLGQDDATTVAGMCGASQGMRYICGPSGIRTKVGNNITVQAQMIEDDIGSAWAIAGVGYM